MWRTPLLIAVLFAWAFPVAAQPKSYRLPGVDLKQRIIWGSTVELPDGAAVSFGGQDQEADDGMSHTRVRRDGQWRDIHEELRKANPLQPLRDQVWAAREEQKDAAARLRALYFSGRAKAEDLTADGARLKATATPLQTALKRAEQARDAFRAFDTHFRVYERAVTPRLPQYISHMIQFQQGLEQVAEQLDAEPAGRALSPLACDAKTGLVVLFGGDHLDYLTNDTWVFDPKKPRWELRTPATAPSPRANHTLRADGQGKIILTGGYTYTSNTDYLSGQYRDRDDGEWIYDIITNTWTGPTKGVASGSRVYRTGPFHPDFYLDGPAPDAAAFAAWLEKLPANTWTLTNPPKLPRLNRDWGTAIFDPDRDWILRWSGGHSAHGGTDVLHYHLATNRWELTHPVEFPLGQLYSNTSYPDGFNFNRRPWITGHTYQNYGYDPVLKKMIFAGREKHFYVYDPDRGDWGERGAKPAGMVYNSCFYTITTTPTPRGLIAWTAAGRLFRFDAGKKTWDELKVTGDKLPGAIVDNSTLAHDSRRNRLLILRKLYGDKTRYDGVLHEVDLKTLVCRKLTPKGAEAATAIPYLCQVRYDADNDLLLVGGTLPGEPRRTPAYDCAGERWVSLKLGGTDPSGPRGRNVSLGLMYDVRRKLFWAVDTDSKVYVLRLDVKNADLEDLE